MIYISTGGDRIRKGYEYVLELMKHGIDAVELSGGAADDSQLEKLKLIKPILSLQVHNYFPPPLEPFVLNLASGNDEISAKSIDLVRKSINWAIELGNPVYSVHAGFLFDPQPKDLGQNISKVNLLKRDQAFELFVERIKMLAQECDSKGVTLLIENNVLTKENLLNFGENPFLLVDSIECQKFMKRMPSNVKLLIDVAHLKVSAKTLQFDAIKMLNECSEWTFAYHLSDNDGISDSNQPISLDSWFWPYLKQNVNFYVLEVYGLLPEELLQQSGLVKQILKI